MTNKPSTLIQSVREDLRERRNARAEYRALRAALATYRSPAEIDDLMLIADGDNADSAIVRDILSDNLRRHHAIQPATVGGFRYSA